jgi:hypothetical protein
VKARLAAGLGKREEAIAALEEVREAFNSREIPYDAALATLELPTLYLEDGRTGEVQILALELKWIFTAEGIEREALAALRLFYEAAEQEALTVELARRMVSFLYRAQHDPELRFEVPDVAQRAPSAAGRGGAIAGVGPDRRGAGADCGSGRGFRVQGVHREALAALQLFKEAAERETATAELARRVLAFLFRARNDQGLQFSAECRS